MGRKPDFPVQTFVNNTIPLNGLEFNCIVRDFLCPSPCNMPLIDFNVTSINIQKFVLIANKTNGRQVQHLQVNLKRNKARRWGDQSWLLEPWQIPKVQNKGANGRTITCETLLYKYIYENCTYYAKTFQQHWPHFKLINISHKIISYVHNKNLIIFHRYWKSHKVTNHKVKIKLWRSHKRFL